MKKNTNSIIIYFCLLLLRIYLG